MCVCVYTYIFAFTKTKCVKCSKNNQTETFPLDCSFVAINFSSTEDVKIVFSTGNLSSSGRLGDEFSRTQWPYRSAGRIDSSLDFARRSTCENEAPTSRSSRWKSRVDPSRIVNVRLSSCRARVAYVFLRKSKRPPTGRLSRRNLKSLNRATCAASPSPHTHTHFAHVCSVKAESGSWTANGFLAAREGSFI